MLENLSTRFQGILKKVRGQSKLTEESIKLALKEVRLSLLEADVNYQVAKDFVKKVKEAALGQEVMVGVNPSQQFIKIVNDELVELLGGVNSSLTKSSKGPTIIMLAGLQGAGKTTFSAKLAKYLRSKGEKPFLVGADVYRPAAMKQLEVLGKELNIPTYIKEGSKNPLEICKEGIEKAKADGRTYIILDTAGRLHVDEALMDELKEIRKEIKPQEILLVVDAMIGQDAVNLAKSFNETLQIDGVVLTKLDGDTRGGAALSIKGVVGKPIKFIGTGEKLDDLELFHPERLASRILGMGDVLSLVEKAESVIDENEAMNLEEKMRTQSFDLEDYLKQLGTIKKMGSLKSIMKMIPGLGDLGDIDSEKAEKEMKRTEAIIQSMTPEERKKPELLKASRKKRIASGSGTNVNEINTLLKRFKDMKQMMKMLSGGNMPKLPGMGGGFKPPFGKR